MPSGHRNSFNENVLHGDISTGNILITTNDQRGHRGILIDYENAIETDHPEDVPDDLLSVITSCNIILALFSSYLPAGNSTFHVCGAVDAGILFSLLSA